MMFSVRTVVSRVSVLPNHALRKGTEGCSGTDVFLLPDLAEGDIKFVIRLNVRRLLPKSSRVKSFLGFRSAGTS
jgi:hypothetical protein